MPAEKAKAKKLNQSEFKLRALLDITNAINLNYSKAKLFELFEFILRNQLGIGSVVLFHRNENVWEYPLRYGTKGLEKKFDITNDLLHVQNITKIQSSSKEHLNQFEVVIPVHHKKTPLAYLLLGKMTGNGIFASSLMSHLTFIQAMTNIVIVAIENKRLVKESLKQERVNKELELASEMQNMLFPSESELPDDDEIQVSALYKPHHQVGGDYYDFFKLREHEYVFCLADVSGKGMPAALLMSNFQAHLRAILEFKPGLNELITELNERVMHSAKGEKFITLFVAIYNKKNRTLNYINAAHNPPLLKTKTEIYTLDTGCTGLGMFDKIPEIQEGLIDIPKDSVILCYTDGVTDQENDEDQPFEIENLKLFLNKNGNLSMQRLNQELINELDEYKGDTPHTDDIALLSCRFR